MSSLARQKKEKEIIDRANRDTERKIRLSECMPSLDFRQLKRENKEEIDFIYNIKKEDYNKYVEDKKTDMSEEIQTKLFERYIKENAKNIKIITVKGEIVGFFEDKILKDNTSKTGNIFILKEYKNKGIETAILNEILFKNKDIMKKEN